MDEVVPGKAVKSPFLDVDVGRNPDLDRLSGRVSDEFEGAFRGVDNFNVLDSAIADLYNFNEATNPDVENVWFNDVVVFPESNYDDVLRWAEEVAGSIDGDYSVRILDDFGIHNDTRNMYADQADVTLRVGDYHDRENLVRVDEFGGNIAVEDLVSELEEFDFGAEANDSGASNVYNVNMDRGSAKVKPDLLTGWFDVESDFSSAYSSRVWMPYADEESALFVRGDNNGSELDINTQVVRYDGSRTGDFFFDCMKEASQHYLPFFGVPTHSISGEAVEFYLDEEDIDPNIDSTSDIEIRQDPLNDLDSRHYDAERLRDRIYRISAQANPETIISNMDANVTQIGSDENYLRWKKEGDTVIVKELYSSREDAILGDDRT